MARFNHRSLLFVLFCLGALLKPAVALADGGTLRSMVEDRGLTISVFTSPTVLTAGEVDISILVQDAKSRETLADAQVQVAIIPRKDRYLAERHEATQELATNRLMRSSHVQLEPGWHDIEVLVRDNNRRGVVKFAILFGPPPTMAASYWPWFTWPAVPIILVAVNLAYRQLRSRRSDIIKRSIANSARAIS